MEDGLEEDAVQTLLCLNQEEGEAAGAGGGGRTVQRSVTSSQLAPAPRGSSSRGTPVNCYPESPGSAYQHHMVCPSPVDLYQQQIHSPFSPSSGRAAAGGGGGLHSGQDMSPFSPGPDFVRSPGVPPDFVRSPSVGPDFVRPNSRASVYASTPQPSPTYACSMDNNSTNSGNLNYQVSPQYSPAPNHVNGRLGVAYSPGSQIDYSPGSQNSPSQPFYQRDNCNESPSFNNMHQTYPSPANNNSSSLTQGNNNNPYGLNIIRGDNLSVSDCASPSFPIGDDSCMNRREPRSDCLYGMDASPKCCSPGLQQVNNNIAAAPRPLPDYGSPFHHPQHSPSPCNGGGHMTPQVQHSPSPCGGHMTPQVQHSPSPCNGGGLMSPQACQYTSRRPPTPIVDMEPDQMNEYAHAMRSDNGGLTGSMCDLMNQLPQPQSSPLHSQGGLGHMTPHPVFSPNRNSNNSPLPHLPFQYCERPLPAAAAAHMAMPGRLPTPGQQPYTSISEDMRDLEDYENNIYLQQQIHQQQQQLQQQHSQHQQHLSQMNSNNNGHAHPLQQQQYGNNNGGMVMEPRSMMQSPYPAAQHYTVPPESPVHPAAFQYPPTSLQPLSPPPPAPVQPAVCDVKRVLTDNPYVPEAGDDPSEEERLAIQKRDIIRGLLEVAFDADGAQLVKITPVIKSEEAADEGSPGGTFEDHAGDGDDELDEEEDSSSDGDDSNEDELKLEHLLPRSIISKSKDTQEGGEAEERVHNKGYMAEAAAFTLYNLNQYDTAAGGEDTPDGYSSSAPLGGGTSRRQTNESVIDSSMNEVKALTDDCYEDIEDIPVVGVPIATCRSLSDQTHIDAESDGEMPLNECRLPPRNCNNSSDSDDDYEDIEEYLEDEDNGEYPHEHIEDPVLGVPLHLQKPTNKNMESAIRHKRGPVTSSDAVPSSTASHLNQTKFSDLDSIRDTSYSTRGQKHPDSDSVVSDLAQCYSDEMHFSEDNLNNALVDEKPQNIETCSDEISEPSSKARIAFQNSYLSFLVKKEDFKTLKINDMFSRRFAPMPTDKLSKFNEVRARHKFGITKDVKVCLHRLRIPTVLIRNMLRRQGLLPSTGDKYDNGHLTGRRQSVPQDKYDNGQEAGRKRSVSHDNYVRCDNGPVDVTKPSCDVVQSPAGIARRPTVEAGEERYRSQPGGECTTTPHVLSSKHRPVSSTHVPPALTDPADGTRPDVTMPQQLKSIAAAVKPGNNCQTQKGAAENTHTVPIAQLNIDGMNVHVLRTDSNKSPAQALGGGGGGGGGGDPLSYDMNKQLVPGSMELTPPHQPTDCLHTVGHIRPHPHKQTSPSIDKYDMKPPQSPVVASTANKTLDDLNLKDGRTKGSKHSTSGDQAVGKTSTVAQSPHSSGTVGALTCEHKSTQRQSDNELKRVFGIRKEPRVLVRQMSDDLIESYVHGDIREKLVEIPDRSMPAVALEKDPNEMIKKDIRGASRANNKSSPYMEDPDWEGDSDSSGDDVSEYSSDDSDGEEVRRRNIRPQRRASVAGQNYREEVRVEVRGAGVIPDVKYQQDSHGQSSVYMSPELSNEEDAREDLPPEAKKQKVYTQHPTPPPPEAKKQMVYTQQPTPPPEPKKQMYTQQPTSPPEPKKQVYTQQPTSPPEPKKQVYTQQPTSPPEPKKQMVYTQQPTPPPEPKKQMYTQQPTSPPEAKKQVYTQQPTSPPEPKKQVYTQQPTSPPEPKKQVYTQQPTSPPEPKKQKVYIEEPTSPAPPEPKKQMLYIQQPTPPPPPAPKAKKQVLYTQQPTPPPPPPPPPEAKKQVLCTQEPTSPPEAKKPKVYTQEPTSPPEAKKPKVYTQEPTSPPEAKKPKVYTQEPTSPPEAKKPKVYTQEPTSPPEAKKQVYTQEPTPPTEAKKQVYTQEPTSPPEAKKRPTSPAPEVKKQMAQEKTRITRADVRARCQAVLCPPPLVPPEAASTVSQAQLLDKVIHSQGKQLQPLLEMMFESKSNPKVESPIEVLRLKKRDVSESTVENVEHVIQDDSVSDLPVTRKVRPLRIRIKKEQIAVVHSPEKTTRKKGEELLPHESKSGCQGEKPEVKPEVTDVKKPGLNHPKSPNPPDKPLISKVHEKFGIKKEIKIMVDKLPLELSACYEKHVMECVRVRGVHRDGSVSFWALLQGKWTRGRDPPARNRKRPLHSRAISVSKDSKPSKCVQKSEKKQKVKNHSDLNKSLLSEERPHVDEPRKQVSQSKNPSELSNDQGTISSKEEPQQKDINSKKVNAANGMNSPPKSGKKQSAKNDCGEMSHLKPKASKLSKETGSKTLAASVAHPPATPDPISDAHTKGKSVTKYNKGNRIVDFTCSDITYPMTPKKPKLEISIQEECENAVCETPQVGTSPSSSTNIDGEDPTVETVIVLPSHPAFQKTSRRKYSVTAQCRLCHKLGQMRTSIVCPSGIVVEYICVTCSANDQSKHDDGDLSNYSPKGTSTSLCNQGKSDDDSYIKVFFEKLRKVAEEKRVEKAKYRGVDQLDQALYVDGCSECSYHPSGLKDMVVHNWDQHSLMSCSLCNIDFYLPEQLFTHLKLHKTDEAFCILCGVRAPNFFNHLYTSHNIDSCTFCGLKISSTAHLEEHMSSVKGIKFWAGRSVCPKDECGFSICSLDLLLKHLWEFHDEKLCPLCPQECLSLDELLSHMASHGGCMIEEDDEDEPPLNQNLERLPTVWHHCTTCDFQFSSLLKLTKHRWFVHGDATSTSDDKRFYFPAQLALCLHLDYLHQLTCWECGQSENFLSDLVSHLWFEHTYHACYICLEKCDSAEHLEAHLVSHRELRLSRETCPYVICKHTFSDLKQLVLHLWAHHGERRCLFCDVICKSQEHFWNHAIVHNGQRNIPNWDYWVEYLTSTDNLTFSLMCPLCSFCAPTSNVLYVHLFDEHGARKCLLCENYIMPSENASTCTAHQPSSHPPSTTCASLAPSSSSSSAMSSPPSSSPHPTTIREYIQHMSEHQAQEYSLLCGLCGQRFNRDSDQKAHLRTSHGVLSESAFRCDICKEMFHSLAAVTNHVLEVHEKRLTSQTRVYVCDICNKEFQGRIRMKTHEGTHANRTFECEHCGQCFLNKWVLNDHKRTHTGEKPYGCPVCDRYFTRSDNLYTHMRTHTGSKPFSCRICKKAFGRADNAKKHEFRCMKVNRGGSTGSSSEPSTPSTPAPPFSF